MKEDEKMDAETENISRKENELAALPVRRLFFKLAVSAVTAQVINMTGSRDFYGGAYLRYVQLLYVFIPAFAGC